MPSNPPTPAPPSPNCSRSLRSIAQSLHLPLDVHLYSDMQQTGMPANFNDLRLNADVQLEPHPLVEKQPSPISPWKTWWRRGASTTTGRRACWRPSPASARPRAMRNVSLVLNGRAVETKSVEVPENGRATVEFLSLDVPYGRNKGEVKIDSADTLPADDIFYFSVERADPRHALFVHEADNTRGLLYFKAALEASGQSAFEIDPATVEQTTNSQPVEVRLRGALRRRRAARRLSKTSCATTCAAAARC